jgi:cyclopropane fatty-acyl-phospholipid synthase-like methyltransferase
VAADSEPLQQFSELIAPGRTILDAGCGDGLPVDAYLAEHGFAVNGIDVSPRKIEIARVNVPGGFYEVKDMLDLTEGEYCVDGVVSLRAMLRIPRARYRALIEDFASFMPRGGGLLLAMRMADQAQVGAHAHHEVTTGSDVDEDGNAEMIEAAGFRIILSKSDGAAQQRHQIILARS